MGVALNSGLERLLAVLEGEGETEDAEKVRGWLGLEPVPAPTAEEVEAAKESEVAVETAKQEEAAKQVAAFQAAAAPEVVEEEPDTGTGTYENRTRVQLLELAKERGLKGLTASTKDEIIDALREG